MCADSRRPGPGTSLAVAAAMALLAACTLGLAARADAPAGPPPAAGPFDVTEKSIPELVAAMEAGTVTSRALVEAYLARMRAYDQAGPALNAMLFLNPAALDTADARDRERREGRVRGPLHGIPVVLKDNYDTADMPTTGGSVALAGLQPAEDAFQVRKLRAAGAVILGKTNLHELASGILTVSSLGGYTRNPYDPSRNPGGSSGGTAAAVAASFASFGMGSDTCASIRVPAAHNNLVGLRGSEGLSSRAGILPLSHTQDVGGPLARTVTDLAIALDVTVGYDPADPTTELGRSRVPGFREALRADRLRGARIGALKAWFGDSPEENRVSTVVRAALDRMQELGAEIVDVDIPNLAALTQDAGVLDYEFKFDLIDYLARTPNPPVGSLAEILERGLHHAAVGATFTRRNAVKERDSEEYRSHLAGRTALRDAVLAAFDQQRLDAIAYPPIRQTATLVGEPQPGSNCRLSAYTGLPAISFPAGFTEDGLPVGIEMAGRPFSDADLVGFAYAFEQATRLRRAPVTTPPLVGGQRPPAAPFVILATGDAVIPPAASGVVGRMDGTVDVTTGETTYSLEVTGVEAADVLAVTLHRGSSGSAGPVLFRLLDRGLPAGPGTLTLSARDRSDLLNGRLYLQIATRAWRTGAARGAVRRDTP